MPISFVNIASNTAQVTFAWAGESITLDYYPGRITEQVIAAMQMTGQESTMEEAMAAFASFNEHLVGLLAAWDVFEDEAQTSMFPLEAQRIAELPILFRVACFEAILRDMRPETAAPGSNGHSGAISSSRRSA